MDKQGRERLRFVYWLDARKRDQLHLIHFCESLKDSREFATVIRLGLRLMKFLRDIQVSALDVIDLLTDLKAGHVDVLLNLFPHVRHHPDLVGHEAAEELFAKQLERLEALILQQGGTAAVPRQPLTSTQPDLDFDFEIKQAGRDENNNSTWNFLLASAANVFGNYDGIAEEIIEYGVRTGRIPKDKIPKSNGVKVTSNGSGNAKQMVVPQFDPPDFDDDDFILEIQE